MSHVNNDCDNFNATGREGQKVLDHMELATGITNRQLVKEIDQTFAKNNYQSVDYTVAPNKFFSKYSEGPPLIKRR